MVFSSLNLVVRNLQSSDLEAFHEMQSDDQVMKYTTEDGKGLSRQTNQTQLDGCIAAYDQSENHFWVWAIENHTGDFVGTCAIVRNENGEDEIGYRFLRRYWGLGYGKQIVDPLLDFGVGNLKLPELVAYVDIRNIASVRILDSSKMDFVREREADGVTDRIYVYRLSLL